MTVPRDADGLVALPVGRMVGLAIASAAAVGVLAALGSVLARPEGLSGAWTGAVAAAAGLAFGTLIVGPWKPRPVAAWPMLLLAGHGAAMLGVLAVGLLLYSATRPDPVVFLAAAAAPFPIATIAQARLAVAPALIRKDAGAGQAPGPELQ
jgi:hypothetical protein